MANESIVFGSTSSPLSEITLGQLLAQQTKERPNSTAVVFHWQKVRYTYAQLSERTNILAKAFLDAGLQKGDCVGVFAGNRWEYIEAFLAAARIGIIYVVLNSAYTPVELATAVKVSSCKLLFIANTIGPRDMSEHIETVCGNVKNGPQLPELKRVVTLETYKSSSSTVEILNYNNFFLGGYSVFMNEITLRRAEKKVGNNDILNLQFTSGTTGAPKAAELTHRNLINNGRLVGAKQKLTPDDVICCPPPLFHCFGLVMGFLAAMFHGCPIVFTSDVFNPDLVLDALVEERCTSLYGVPTMFVGVLEANERKKCDLRGIGRLRTGVAAGASVPMAIMKKISSIMGIDGMLIAYGMTETSPVTWMTSLNDTLEQRTSTVGTMMEHSGGKIIGKDGQILPRGERGELCTSGYALQRGYWRNPAKTEEAMKTDENGIRWMHTGDEGLIDNDGFCKITGRIKDMIIRGGENIFPLEIEERLLTHPSIAEASVVGIQDHRYGEVVAAYLKSASKQKPRPSNADLQNFVRETLGRHKAPVYIFWLGDEGVGDDFPKTASGKHQKHIMRATGEELVKKGKGRDEESKAKL